MFYKYASATRLGAYANKDVICSYEGSSYVHVSAENTIPDPFNIHAHKLDKKQRTLEIVASYSIPYATPLGDICTDGTYIYAILGTGGGEFIVQALSFDGTSYTLVAEATIDTTETYAFVVNNGAFCRDGVIYATVKTSSTAGTYLFALNFDGSTVTELGRKFIATVQAICARYTTKITLQYNYTNKVYLSTYTYSAGVFSAIDTAYIDLGALASSDNFGYCNGYLYFTAEARSLSDYYIGYVSIDSNGALGNIGLHNYSDYTESYDEKGFFNSDGEYLYLRASNNLYAYEATGANLVLKGIYDVSSSVKSIACDSRFIYTDAADDAGTGTDLQCLTFGRSAPNAKCLARYSESI